MAQMKAAAASASAASVAEDLCALTAAIDLAADCILPHCALTPTRPIYTDIESVTVVDLREALVKGAAHAGSSTSCLQLFPPPAPEPSAAASERKQADDSHPLVWPLRSDVRFSFEVEFVRSMACELTVDQPGGWELLSLHRLFNEQWLQRFQSHQKALAPQLFKSSASLSGHHPGLPTLLHLIKFSNQSDVGTPVFAWHGTTARAIPSIMQHGLSTRFCVNGGPNIYVSQQFSHSIAYCRKDPSVQSHMLLCAVLRTPAEMAQCTAAPFHQLAIPDEARVIPIFHLVVQATPAV